MLDYFSDFIVEFITELWPVTQLCITILLHVMRGNLHSSKLKCGNSWVIHPWELSNNNGS